MVAREMQEAFQQHLEARLDYHIPPVLSDDVSHFLEEAQRDMYDERFRQFELDQKITDDFSPFIVRDLVIDATYNTPSYDGSIPGFYVDSIVMPADYRHLISCRIQIFKANSGDFDFEVIDEVDPTPDHREPNSSPAFTTYTTQNVQPQFRQQDDLNTLLMDPYHTTISSEPIVTISQNGLEVYTDTTFIVDKAIITYVATAAEIDITQGTGSLFPAFTHRELVRRAVDKYLSILNNQNNKE